MAQPEEAKVVRLPLEADLEVQLVEVQLVEVRQVPSAVELQEDLEVLPAEPQLAALQNLLAHLAGEVAAVHLRQG